MIVGRKKSTVIGTFLKWAYLLLLLIICVVPLLWIFISSFKTKQDIFSSPFKISFGGIVENYSKAFQIKELFEVFGNTVFVSIMSTFIVLLITAMASYALLHKFRLSRKIFLLLISGIYIPVNAFMVPYFMVIITLGLYNTLWGLITIYVAIGMPLSLLIVYNYMTSIPKELFEAAKVDGSNFFKTFFRIIFPLSIPGMATVATFQVINFWNEFLFATILTQDSSARTLQVSLRYFKGTFLTDYGTMFAIMSIALIPTIIFYVIFQRQIVSGMTSGAVKG